MKLKLFKTKIHANYYADNRNIIAESNLQTFFIGSISAAIISGIEVIAALTLFKRPDMACVFFFVFAAGLISVILAAATLLANKSFTLPAMYALIAVIYIATIILGTFLSRGRNAVVFISLAALLPSITCGCSDGLRFNDGEAPDFSRLYSVKRSVKGGYAVYNPAMSAPRVKPETNINTV